MNIKLEISKETEKLTLEGLWFRQALVLATRIFKNSIKYSLAENEDIDNGEVYDRDTGKTIRDL